MSENHESDVRAELEATIRALIADQDHGAERVLVAIESSGVLDRWVIQSGVERFGVTATAAREAARPAILRAAGRGMPEREPQSGFVSHFYGVVRHAMLDAVFQRTI